MIIGGKAARLRDAGHATGDIDSCPSTDSANLSNLADALRELGTRLRVEGHPGGATIDLHPETFRQIAMMTLVTEHGPLDLCFAPAGFPDGYASMHRSS